MPPFSYKAKDKSGAFIEGSMEADSRSTVISRLQQMGYFPVAIHQGQKGRAPAAKAEGRLSLGGLGMPKLGGGGASSAAIPRTSSPSVPRMKVKEKAKRKTKEGADGGLFGRRKRVRAADLATFNRQMSDLLGAGVALVKALTILGRQTDNIQMEGIIAEINSDVQGGATFADALARHPKVFSKLYVAMVRSGETGGMLPDVLQRLADFSEQEEALKGRIKSALAYPAVMVVAGGAAVAVMFSYVVPRIVSTFRELNQALPGPTQLLIMISDGAQKYWPFLIGGVALAVFAAWRFIHTDEGRALWHRWQLRIPIMGDVVRKREVARFTRTLGSLLKNGVPILTALGITKDVANNTVVKAEVDKVTDEIKQGEGIARPLRNSAIFPPVTVNMMAVGEETGQLENVLLRISDSFEMEVDRKVKTLTSLLEPLIIVAMGLVVGFIVISMLLPIFSLDPAGASG